MHDTNTSSSGTNSIAPGDRVVDREGEESLAVVVSLADVPAHEYYIPSLGDTVANVNPAYSADAPVATIVFVGELADYLGRWEQYSADVLRKHVREGGLQTYAYPADRLRVARKSDAARSEGGETA